MLHKLHRFRCKYRMANNDTICKHNQSLRNSIQQNYKGKTTRAIVRIVSSHVRVSLFVHSFDRTCISVIMK